MSILPSVQESNYTEHMEKIRKSLPLSPERTNLEWCSAVLQWMPLGVEYRALNIAINTAIEYYAKAILVKQ